MTHDDPQLPGVTFRRLGEGELGRLIRAKDWSTTPLGPIERWPQTLQGYVAMVLALPQPAIIFWGPEQRQLYNDGYATIMGPRHPRFLGGTYRECWPDTHPTIYPWMRRVLEAGEVVEVERALIPLTRHGFNEEAFFTFTFSPLRDDDGNVAGILQLVREMTGPVLAERRASTLRALSPFVSRHGAREPTRIVDALSQNRADIPFALHWSAERLGTQPTLSLEGVTGLSLTSLPDGVRSPLERLAREVFDEDAPRLLQGPALAALLPELHVGPWPEPVTTAVVHPIRRDGEPPRGVLLLGVSPRLHFDTLYAEFFTKVAAQCATFLAAGQESQLADHLALVLDSAKMGSWRVDLRTRRIVLFDRTASFLGMDGASEEEFDTLNAKAVHPDDLVRVMHTFQQAVDRNDVYACEYRIQRADGAVRWLSSWGRATYDVDGAALSVTGVTLDVTEQVEARQRIERLVEQLASSVNARDEFISIASHELKTPLSGLKLQVQGVLRQMSRGEPSVYEPERVKRLVDGIDRQGRRLARLVDDMLDVGRLTTGRLSIVRARGSLSTLVKEVTERLQPEFEAAHTPLEVSCAPDLELELDRDRIEQVLANLLTNALRYGGRTPVTLKVTDEGDRVRVSVEDRGHGLSAENHTRVFERFERAISPNEVSGLGLGLYISRQIVEGHGGRIWVESEEGRGATFRFELPKRASESSATSAHTGPGAAVPSRTA